MSRTVVKAILVLLYIGAVWLRFDGGGNPVYPYFKDVSGTNFRQIHQIVTDGALPEVDQRAAWPDGFEPARVKPNGIEYLFGFSFRLAQPFTDMPEQRFVRWFAILLFSLTVFSFYVLTRRLWLCQTAGLFSALLIAAMVPVIQLTNGREFLHSPFAVVLISIHLALAIGFFRKPSILNAVVTGLAGIALFTIWESAALYVVVVSTAILSIPGWNRSARKQLLVAHLAAVIVAGLLLPHLQAQRFLFSWPAIWVLLITVFAFYGHKLPGKIPGLAYVAGGTVILTLICRPIQSGGLVSLPPLDYWYTRLRYLTGKPDDPGLLSNMLRNVWTHDHSFARGYTMFAFFLPLIVMAVPALAGLRELRGKYKFPWWIPFIVVVVGILVMALDRQAVPFAALLVFPLVSAAMVSFRKHLRTRVVPVAIAAVLVLMNAWAPTGPANATFRIGDGLGLSPTVPTGFAWVSLGNADRGIVRYLVTRTSTRQDVILATPEQSSLVNTFAGRSTALAPGINTRDMAFRVTAAIERFYSSEAELYEFCTTNSVTHVLYSIDILLDTSKYSPLYLAGRTSIDDGSVGYTMHFAPETLRHFNLVFENDNYRIFRVTSEIQPMFITDHPPVYQSSIMQVHGDNFESFYRRIVDVLLAYQSGVNAQSRDNDRGAIPRFRYCLDRAPYFTKARLGEGDSQLRLGDYETALTAYRRVLEYAPDNTHALYYGALSLLYLGRNQEALPLLDLLLSSTGNRDIRSQATELKALLESGRPLQIPRPPNQNPPDTTGGSG